MSKVGRKKNTKSKHLLESSTLSEKGSKMTHQTDISQYFCEKIDESLDHLGLPEGSLPSPDDAALPCSTSLCSITSKNSKKEVPLDSNQSTDVAQEVTVKPIIREKKGQKISDMTNKVIAEVSKKKRSKKQTEQIRSHQVTEFFPVRRSIRKTLPNVLKEKRKMIEDAILSGKEDGFEIKEFPGKGRGVITKQTIKRGDFVLEYYGELISLEKAKERELIYSLKENTGCYMYYFKYQNKTYCVDATKESGRLGRLINHSKKGNLKTQPYYLQESPHLAFFACRDIEPGEELLYDYGDRSKQALESHPWLAL